MQIFYFLLQVISMNCYNDFCIYENEGECKLSEISIDEQGHCNDCIYVTLDENELKHNKKKLLLKLHKRPEDGSITSELDIPWDAINEENMTYDRRKLVENTAMLYNILRKELDRKQFALLRIYLKQLDVLYASGEDAADFGDC